MKKILILIMTLAASFLAHSKDTIRVASFNVSMEAGNYVERGVRPTGDELFTHLASGTHPQIKNIAEIIQRIRPDIVLLNEFDYIDDNSKGIDAFQRNYLSKAQQGAHPIHYPYVFTAPVNTGVKSGVDLNNDGKAEDAGGDAFGFGLYPGQYAMVLLSQYPIDFENIRTFQKFLWKDMPENGLSKIKTEQGTPWYSQQAQEILRLSSKSHWDVPVNVNGKTVHVLASHPTPPVFDGPEDRNGHRNHDEIRFWTDYLTEGKGSYIYDDAGISKPFAGNRFVILGDLNASPVEGDAHAQAIRSLIGHPKVNSDVLPQSKGGAEHSPDNQHGASHTAAWRMRADYVLVSEHGFDVTDSGVFWPEKGNDLYRLIEDRKASSDHRLVWVDVKVTE